jgi:hypothetical protein
LGMRESCQKKLQVRTGLVGEEEKLSEVPRSSDSFGRRKGKAVKRSIKFGQLSQGREKAVRRSTKFGQVWSGRRKRKSCQEKSGIVTGLTSEEEKLSRKDQNRDRFEGEAGKAVKKRPEL